MAITCVDSVMDWQLSKESVKDRIQTLFKTSQWSDCSFRVEGRSDTQMFKAHRLILASCSPVFEAMCFGPLAEKKCVNISDIEPDVFRILLEYVYTDSVKFSSCEEAAGVLYAANKYMLPHLASACRDYLVTNLRPSNVLSIFEFAGDIQEDKLLAACVKVTCQHAGEVLKSPACHISPFTLRTVLEQSSLNITEAELFSVALDWAKEECALRGLDGSPDNLRAVMLKAGALCRIRFLCLSPKEFADGPLLSGILKPEEAYSLQRVLQSKCTRPPLPGVPPGWSGATQPRGRISVSHFYCMRRFLKTAVTVSGRVRLLTNVQVDQSVVVSGVRIFTRLVPSSLSCSPPPLPTYRERIEVSVLDQQGSVLCHTHFQEVVEYNTLATVTLSEGVRFGSNTEYSFLFVLPTEEDQLHEYPLSFMAQTERSHDIEFRFCDHADIGGSGVFVRRLDMGFVDTVVYSL